MIVANSSSPLDGLSVLVTGGTGSFGQTMVSYLLQKTQARRVIVFSRDELKQWQMRQTPEFQNPRLRFFLGCIRDKQRLVSAFRKVDCVIHAAALKQVPAAEYNPTEFIQTNVIGTLNVTEAAVAAGVSRALFLSTDKAVSPINLYGASKLCAEKLVLAAGVYSDSEKPTHFSVVRYGNVMNSRGSVIELWNRLLKEGKKELPITDTLMTRFWLTLDQAIQFVYDAICDMKGGEIFVPKLPSMKLTELAKTMDPTSTFKVTGIRPGEKLHEMLLSPHESCYGFEDSRRFIVIPELEGPDYLHDSRDYWKKTAKKLPANFCFASNENCETLSSKGMQELLAKLDLL